MWKRLLHKNLVIEGLAYQMSLLHFAFEERRCRMSVQKTTQRLCFAAHENVCGKGSLFLSFHAVCL